MNNPRWLESREIVERIIIRGNLVLETPAYFGSGDHDEIVDISLDLDPLEGRTLLTGASLAGALRSYLRECEHGFGKQGDKKSLYMNLFGNHENDEGEQSFLIVNDSLGEKPKIELRDGIKIDGKTRTAKDKGKFDFELIEAGACFPIEIELLLPREEKRKEKLLLGLAIALHGLEKGEISLGFRKRRGFGRCRIKEWNGVKGWNVCRYDLTTPKGLIDWLNLDKGEEKSGQNILTLLGISESELLDKRCIFQMDATFSLDGSMIIRSGYDEVNAPDTVHLHSKRNDESVPVLSGTSLAGALRARAFRIANTIQNSTTTSKDNQKAREMINNLFGPEIEKPEDKAFASKLITAETEIINPLKLVQQRIKIDRFTGSSFPTALFDEQPVFEQSGTKVKLKVQIQKPDNAQIGLLLLLLKDLWTRDLPLGGEASIGRGRLIGQEAELSYKTEGPNYQEWKLKQRYNGKLEIVGDREKLEGFVNNFVSNFSEETQHDTRDLKAKM
jgi:CRISPR/Cas system CSM-associated protein Csm3 (group 7 of RAMP superfamily)